MPLRLQEGGDVDEADDTGGGGALSMDPAQLMMSLFLNQGTTSPEGKAFAQKYLDQELEDLKKPASSPALAGLKTQAEEVRAALKKAQQRLTAKPAYDPANMWLALSEGLGQTTKSGSPGEGMSNVAKSLRGALTERTKAEDTQREEMNKLDLQLAGAGGPEAAAQLKLEEIQQRLKGKLAEESLKALVKPTTGKTNPGASVIPRAAEALDNEYLKKEYVPFVTQGGSSKSAQALETLGFASKQLKSGKDTLTGPYVGTITSIPYVGEAIQDTVFPAGADVRDLILQNVQESLRPILGSQFTQQEGERLMKRVYNPRLEEWRNARKLDWLIEQLKRAQASKVAAAQYFEKNHTMYGYKGKYIYSVDDFVPPEEIGKTKGPQLTPEARRSLQEGAMLYLPGDPTPQQKAEGGIVRLQKGGEANPDLILPPEAKNEGPDSPDMWDKIQALWQQSGILPDLLGGAVGGLGVEHLLKNLQRQISASPGERRVIDAIHESGQSPVGKAEEVKRGSRAGVPSMLIDADSPGVRAIAKDALTHGGAEADEALNDLRNRVEGSRERVNEQVNKGLKPYEYYSMDNKLVGQILDKNPDTVLRPVFDQYKGLPIDPAIAQILETPEGKKAMSWAFKFYQNVPGKKAGTTDLQGMVTKPSLEFYDKVIRGFDQNIAKEEADGRTEFGDVLRNLRGMLVNRVDQLAPEYKGAREDAGMDLEVRDALHAGKDFQKLAPEQVAEVVANLGFHQKNAFRTGAAQSLYEMLNKSSSDNFNAAQKLVGSPAMMAKLEPMFDNPQQLKIFRTALEKEAELVRSGNQTIRQGEDARLVKAQTRESWGEYAAKRLPGFRFAISPVGWALRLFRDRPKMTEKTADQVLDVLQRGDPKEMDAFIRSSQRLAKLRGFRGARRGAAAALGAGAEAVREYFIGDENNAEEQP